MSFPLKRRSVFNFKEYFGYDEEENLENKYRKKNLELKNYKSDNNNNIKKHKKKNIYKLNQKKYPSTALVKKNSNNIFESLINIEKDDEEIDNDKQNKTFSINSKIKQKLLKEYNEEQKFEKKYRRIQVISNLYDSLDDNEDITDEEENTGLNFYISSDSTLIFIFDFILIIFSFYNLFFIPLSLAGKKYYCEKEITISMVPKYFTEIIFILDLLITSIKSYYNYEYKEITLTKKIIKHYLGNGFFLDLMEAIPCYIISRVLCNKKELDTNYLSNKELILSILLIMKTFKIFKVLNNKNNRAIEILYERISEYYLFEQILNIVIYLIV